MREANAKAKNVMSRPKRSDNVSVPHLVSHRFTSSQPPTRPVSDTSHTRSATLHLNVHVHNCSAAGAANACKRNHLDTAPTT